MLRWKRACHSLSHGKRALRQIPLVLTFCNMGLELADFVLFAADVTKQDTRWFC